mmetsp:Transcript_10399/g.22086  ORF Transcript_10399/g.22086 Transcript_10399/m.22086 type:complete len:277 (+) Transcript_10399:304-1134(+)
MTTVQRTVAVLYATSGGMGDVGKFAVALAREQQAGEAAASGWQVRAIAMDSNDGANNGFGTSVDVEDEESKEKVDNWFVPYEMIKIDVASDSSERKIRESLEGVDAVISCLGNRQPKMERWCSVGTKKVINAMKANNIRRLVSLSSMGIGKDDFFESHGADLSLDNHAPYHSAKCPQGSDLDGRGGFRERPRLCFGASGGAHSLGAAAGILRSSPIAPGPRRTFGIYACQIRCGKVPAPRSTHSNPTQQRGDHRILLQVLIITTSQPNTKKESQPK